MKYNTMLVIVNYENIGCGSCYQPEKHVLECQSTML